LSVAVSSDTILILDSGTYDVNNGESFPLISPIGAQDLTLQGRGATKPVLTADGFSATSWNPNWPSTQRPWAAIVGAGNGWTIKNLRIESPTYDKSMTSGDLAATTALAENQIIGIHARSVVPGNGSHALRILDCQVDDNYWGIYIEDLEGTSDPGGVRPVLISGCVVSEHGPTRPVGLSTDLGHGGIVVGGHPSLEVEILNCISEENHDGIEGGQQGTMNQTTMRIESCTIRDNESGIEAFANDIEVTDCLIQLNERLNPTTEGGVNNVLSTVGIGYRPGSGSGRLEVRETDFDRNQTSFWAFSGTAVELDFGRDYSANRGGNVFTVDTTAPWPAADSYRVTYVCMFTNNDQTIHAVANTWTYKTPIVQPPNNWEQDYNQGANQNGQFPSGGATVEFLPATNVDGSDDPNRRPIVGEGYQHPNRPWNFAVSSGGLSTKKIVVRP
ncbi:MAG: hypothetical protein ACF8XB_22990, partial [Planctomycetota bacterium JB042]